MMSEQQFDARLQVIEEQHAAGQERIDGKRDQAMARLFLESDWSQEKLAAHLAKRWGKEVSRQWVGCHLLLGRFLAFFATAGGKEGAPGADFLFPLNLTERAFRRFWGATEPTGDFRGHKANTEASAKDERRRFAEVIEALKGMGLRRKAKPVRDAIIKTCLGQWLTLEGVRSRVDAEIGRAHV